MKHGVREVVLLSNFRIFRTQFLKEFFEPKVSIKQTLNYTHFFVKRIMSFPIRIVPLKCRNIYITTSENICKSAVKCLIYSKKERAKYGFKNRFRMVFKQNGHKTYDFSPFPYCPIILESTVRLTDRPNCITFPTSAEKQDYGSFILDAMPQRITQRVFEKQFKSSC